MSSFNRPKTMYRGICVGGVWDGRRVSCEQDHFSAADLVGDETTGETALTHYRHALVHTGAIWVPSGDTTDDAMRRLLASYFTNAARERRAGATWSIPTSIPAKE